MIKHRKALDSIKPYVPGKPIDDVKREYGLTEVIKLASNENPLGCSEKAKKAVIEALNQVALYPDGNCTELRELLSKDLNVKTNQLIFGAGADEIIKMIGEAFLNIGDEVVTAEVSFSEYVIYSEAMGAVMKYAKMDEYAFSLPALLEKITDKTRIIFIANPNNPTGSAYGQAEQEEFLKKVPKDILVVIDEAYGEFYEGTDFPDTMKAVENYPNVIRLKTFSKAYGLASLRVGYGVAHPEIIGSLERVRPPFNVSIAAQKAAVEAILDKEYLETSVRHNKESRDYTCRMLDEMGLYYVKTQTNFVMLDTGKDCMEVFTELMKRGYIVRPCKPFGLPSFIRLTFGTLAQMEGFFKAFKEIL